MESVATPIKPHKALAAAQEAAMAAGKLMFQNVRKHKKRQEESQHDIKLELDQRCQRRIEKILRSAFPRAFGSKYGHLGIEALQFKLHN